ncbi:MULTISPECIES: MetQ/NlpA family ABC transporter substrate-binding protein [Salimicrobium]|uniref:Lipoprotein n=3 Tax=Salimicrobium TaxID=351195 RepID=K2GFX3_9BACI|nr:MULTISPECIES: MetQ/NlpA family ABC transporter substrate-binding protein [Salimicrobium]AKG03976.1 methionine ABC transporter substrate-binding protein [Salimicrobium jeotgali]EKE33012.1 methionine ABC transporter extracellular binding protein [Salimicrobium jeotgali]MBM7694993.1 D-methionine transport system substrate-binding protein [Salimicrobium jeotgali]SDY00416.1 D-methionine transport system substrate-binding protein [Salimicrobium album]SIS71582.1 D-methionine transport system subst
MKKFLLTLATIALVSLLAACGSDSSDSGDSEGSDKETSEISVGATSVPHAEVLKEAQPLMEEKGITLNIEEYQDYVLPNRDLSEGEIDANYFQHIPYLNTQMEENGYDFANLGGIHIEPMGIYSKGIESIEDVEDGTTVLMSRSVADHGRILSLLEKEGLVKIDPDVDPVNAKLEDVVENPKNLEFDAGIDAALLPENYEREENALVAINTNYAIQADLNPSEDALLLEGSDSPYVNVIAAKSEDKDSEALNTLVEVLRSDEIQSFMKEQYDGAVVPVDGSDSEK